jgi:RNA polymerase sigma-70 factor (ECF subfamily)
MHVRRYMSAFSEVDSSGPSETTSLAATPTHNVVAWDRVVEIHYDSLFRLALAILRHEEDARDACQEAFHQAFLKLSEWRGECRLDMWLKRIVINRCRDLLRKRQVRHLAADDLARDAELCRLSPETILTGRESLERILRSMDLLPIEFREVLIAHFLEDLPYGDLAQILDISVNAVRIRIHRGLSRLRELIKEDVK